MDGFIDNRVLNVCGHVFSLNAISDMYIFNNVLCVKGINGESSKILIRDGVCGDDVIAKTENLVTIYQKAIQEINSCRGGVE